MIRISCPHCGKVLGVKNPQKGTNIACLHCKQRFVLPYTQAPPKATALPVATPLSPSPKTVTNPLPDNLPKAFPLKDQIRTRPYVLFAGGIFMLLAVAAGIVFTVRSVTRP